MLQKEDKKTHQRIPTLSTAKNLQTRDMEDYIIALSQRMALIEDNLGSKIDRTQCLLMLQTKVNMSNLGKISDQMTSKFSNFQKVFEEKTGEAKRSRKVSLSKRKIGKQQKIKEREKNILFLKPQQLFLQSNETMFGLVVEQIEELKKAIKATEQKIEHKGKAAISLNNEICDKIQKLEKQIRENSKISKQMSLAPSLDSQTSCWSQSEETNPTETKKQKRKKSLNNKQNCSLLQNSSLNIKVQQIQRELTSKISIKDIVAIINNKVDPLQEKLAEMKNYTLSAIENTKVILANQSEINQELSYVSKMAWWYSYEEMDGLALWNKEIANMDPDCFVSQKQSCIITLTKKGHYIVKVLSLNSDSPSSIIIEGNETKIEHETLIQVVSGTKIQLPSQGNQMFLSIQKI